MSTRTDAPLAHEALVALADVPHLDLIPRRRGARPLHFATIRRWAGRGVRGVVLETWKAGATRVTSREALQRFFERLTRASTEATAAPERGRRQIPAEAHS